MEENINNFFKSAGSLVRSFQEGLKKQFIDISVSDVTSILDNIEIKKSQYTTEKNVENIITKALNIAFSNAHQQYSIGGFLALKVDIDIGDGQVGLEIKLAKELKTSGIERLFGQVLYYSKRKYKENLIVLIVGTEKEYTQIIKEVEAIVEEQGVTFYYLSIK